MQTIFALSTPEQRGGVAIIRISGPDAGEALRLLRRAPLPLPRLATFGRFFHPETGTVMDHGLCLWFPAPGSFTGEDVAELHLHGSVAVMRTVLRALSEIPGLRLAEPGEFSKRAFINGKLDLTAAEGLADLINAETELQAAQALRILGGEQALAYENLREAALRPLAHLEACIDFAEEDIPPGLLQTVEEEVELLRHEVEHLLTGGNQAERLREGYSVVILGAPNAGKSSLMNALAKREVAIVSHRAGTTRDVIEAHLNIGGLPVILVDTAGLRDSDDEIEQEGIARARARAATADLRLLVIDGADPHSVSTEVFSLLGQGKSLAVITKGDLLDGTPPDLPFHAIAISAKTGAGLEALLAEIHRQLKDGADLSHCLVTRERHRVLLEEAFIQLESFHIRKPIELACEDLRLAAVALGKITGKIEVDELLGRIFAEFCIGK